MLQLFLTHCCSPMVLCVAGCIPQAKLPYLDTQSPPGSLGVTIQSASSVQTLAFVEIKHSRPPDLKSSSNVSLQFAWITGPTTDPSSNKHVPQIMSHQKSCQYPSINYLVCSPLSSVTFPIPFNFPVEQDSRKKDETSNSGMLQKTVSKSIIPVTPINK